MQTENPLWLRDALSLLREKRPLVHNTTKSVVMNTTANVLLGLGALSIMAYSSEEVEDFAAMAQS
jgi:hydroxyethylthiazole kinase